MSVPERLSPKQCNHPDTQGRVRCFFCQKTAEEAGALRHTKIRWENHTVNTLICRPCMRQWNVPDSYPEAFRVCYFCGYPGDLKESYQEMIVSPGIARGNHLLRPTRAKGGVKVKVCPQCLALFTQLSALKPHSP